MAVAVRVFVFGRSIQLLMNVIGVLATIVLRVLLLLMLLWLILCLLLWVAFVVVVGVPSNRALRWCLGLSWSTSGKVICVLRLDVC